MRVHAPPVEFATMTLGRRIDVIDLSPSSLSLSLRHDQSQHLGRSILQSPLGSENVNVKAEARLEYYEAWKGNSRDGSLVVDNSCFDVIGIDVRHGR